MFDKSLDGLSDGMRRIFRSYTVIIWCCQSYNIRLRDDSNLRMDFEDGVFVINFTFSGIKGVIRHSSSKVLCLHVYRFLFLFSC